MSLLEETIEATLDPSGRLQLSHIPRVSPGPVQVTIRSVNPCTARRGLADVLREIAAEQRARGFPGRSSEEVRSEADEQALDDDERDSELDAARRDPSGSP